MAQQFAAILWEKRWNGSDQDVMTFQDGPIFQVTGWFGHVTCDLRESDDVATIVRKTRAFADMLEGTKRGYDSV